MRASAFLFSLLVTLPLTLCVPIDHSPKVLHASPKNTMFIRMPKHDIAKAEQYSCAGFKLPSREVSVTAFQAKPSDRQRVHHMSLYFCPDRPQLRDGREVSMNGITPCDGGYPFQSRGCTLAAGFEHMDASLTTDPEHRFPKDTGVSVGEGTAFAYAVLEVHNNLPFNADQSGFALTYEPGPVAHQIKQSVIACGPEGGLPPRHDDTSVSCASAIDQSGKPITVVGLHFHFHGLGRRITYSTYHADGSQTEGRVSYVAPTASVSSEAHDSYRRVGHGVVHHKTVTLDEPFTILPTDRVMVKCEYNTMSRSHVTKFGMASTQEMCDIFFEYY